MKEKAVLGDFADSVRRQGCRFLTRDEERALWGRFKAGDLDARDTLVESVLYYVVRLVSRYRPRQTEYADLLGDALLFLVEYVLPRFDPDRGRLTTLVGWAVPRILQRVDNAKRPVFANPPDWDLTPGQAPTPGDIAEQRERAALMRSALEVASITDRNRDILERYVSGESVNAIGESYGLCRQRIHQIVNAVMQEVATTYSTLRGAACR